jgi:hypothetical protein
MTNLQSKDTYELPEYLGFGILNHDSITRGKEGVSATYCSDSELVYTVEWNQKGYEMEEFYEGSTLASSYGENLSTALFHLLASINPCEHPRFFRLADAVIHIGNIHFIWPRMDTGYLYYPSGYLFDLRQPIVNCNHGTWVKLKRKMRKDEGSYPFSLYAEYPGAIFCLNANKRVIKKKTVLAHLACPLLNLYESVVLCQQTGLIPAEKEYRMTVLNAGQSLDSLNLFAGDFKRNIRAFAVFEFGKETGQVPEKQAGRLFDELCRRNCKNE